MLAIPNAHLMRAKFNPRFAATGDSKGKPGFLTRMFEDGINRQYPDAPPENKAKAAEMAVGTMKKLLLAIPIGLGIGVTLGGLASLVLNRGEGSRLKKVGVGAILGAAVGFLAVAVFNAAVSLPKVFEIRKLLAEKKPAEPKT